MPERKYVYRLIVDSWPTADGKPFVDQALEFWEAIVDYFHNPYGEDPAPAWLPDISPYIEDPGDCWTPPNWGHKPPFTRILVCDFKQDVCMARPGWAPAAEDVAAERGYPRGVFVRRIAARDLAIGAEQLDGAQETVGRVRVAAVENLIAYEVHARAQWPGADRRPGSADDARAVDNERVAPP